MIKNIKFLFLMLLLTIQAFTLKAEVLPDGNFLNSIPIEIPQGVNGIQPTLTLSYTSSGTYGIAGPGWALTGFPSIHRIGSPENGLALNETDCFIDPDGPLVFEGQDQDTRHFRGKFISTSKYQGIEFDSNGPRKWKVIDKTGNKMFFGSSTNSRISHDKVKNVYTQWYLDKFETLNGNAYEIFYDDSEQNTRYPKRLNYTVAPGLVANNSVEFFYEPGNSHRIIAETGSLVTYDKRLCKIVVKTNNIVYRTYLLTYATRDPMRPSDHLEKVIITGIDSSTIDKSGQTTRVYSFSWSTAKLNVEKKGYVFEVAESGTSIPLPFNDNHNPTEVTLTIDFNGDGRADIVHIKSGEDMWFFEGQEDGSFAAAVKKPGTAKFMSPGPGTEFYTGDFNGDGKEDILCLRNDRAHTIFPGNSLDSFPAKLLFPDVKDQPAVGFTHKIIVDLNGDGADDLLLIGPDNENRILYGKPDLYSSSDGLQKVTNFALPADTAGNQWSLWGDDVGILIRDFDNNGWPDILRSDSKNQAFLFLQQDGGGFTSAPIPVQATPDLFLLPPYGASFWSTGTIANKPWLANTLIFQDFNNDGRLDILRIAQDNTKHALFLFKGDHFETRHLPHKLIGDDQKAEWRILSDTGETEPRKDFVADRFIASDLSRRVYLGDFNGDGFQDILSTSTSQNNILLIWDGRDYRLVNNPNFTKANLIGDGSNRSLLILDANSDGRDDLLRLIPGGDDDILLAGSLGFAAESDSIPLPKTALSQETPNERSMIQMDVDGNGIPELFVRRSAPDPKKQHELLRLSSVAGEHIEKVVAPDGAVLEIDYTQLRSIVPVAFAPLVAACVPATQADPSPDCGIADKSNRLIVRALSAWSSPVRYSSGREPDEKTTCGCALPRIATKSGEDNGSLGFAEQWVSDEKKGSLRQTIYSQQPIFAHRPIEIRNFANGRVKYEGSPNTHIMLKSAQCGDVPYPFPVGDQGLVDDLMSVECLSYRDWDERKNFRMIAQDHRFFGTFYLGQLMTRHTTEFKYDNLGYLISDKSCVFAQDKPAEQNCTEREIKYLRLPNTKPMGLIASNEIRSDGVITTLEKFDYDDDGQLESVETLLCEQAEKCYSKEDGQFIKTVQGIKYDSHGNITQIEDANGNATHYDYDSSATHIAKETNALKHAIKYSYYPYGLRETVTDPNGQVTRTQYSPFSEIARVQYPDGSWQSKTRRVTENGTPEHLELVSITNGGTHGVIRYYNGFGFEYETVTQGDDPTKKIHELHSREYVDKKLVEKTSMPHFTGETPVWAETHYDYRGRPTKSVFAGQDEANFSYPHGNDTFTKEGRSVSRSVFDFQGRLSSREQAANQDWSNPDQQPELFASIEYSYDRAGRLSRLTAHEGVGPTDPVRQIINSYDSLGRVRERNDYATGISLFTYTPTGQIASEKDAQGRVVKYEYDALNRLIKRNLNNETIETYVYDDPLSGGNGIGRLTSVKDETQDRTFQYDPMGRIVRTTTQFPALKQEFVQTWRYGHQGELLSRRLPEGTQQQFQYSNTGQLQEVSLNGNVLATYNSYRADGQILSYTISSSELGSFGQAIDIENTYNKNTSLESRKLYSPTEVLDNTYISYNQDHTIREIFDNRASTQDRSDINKSFKKADGKIEWTKVSELKNTSRHRQFGYDQLQRLISVSAKETYGNKLFSYNTAGDITQIDGPSSRRLDYINEFRETTDSPGRPNSALIKITSPDNSLEYCFDKAGDLTSRKIGNDTLNFKFGVFHRLSSVRKDQEKVAEYFYDHANKRRHSKIYTDNNSSVDTYYITPQFEISIASQFPNIFKVTRHLDTPSGERISSFTTLETDPLQQSLPSLLKYAHEPINEIEREEFERINLEQDDLYDSDFLKQVRLSPRLGFWFFHYDYLGSISLITDVTGKVRSRLNYLPYGELSLPHSTGELISDIGFGGTHFEDLTGLYYLDSRFYDPKIGRFISPDTILPDNGVDYQNINRYAYASNNPAIFIDPSGHWSLKKGWKSITSAVKKVYKAGEAVVHGIEHAIRNTVETGRNFIKNVTHKPLDAYADLYIDTYKGQERAFRSAMMESTLLQQVAAIVATVYGGPAGAAAFSAYMTYASGGTMEQVLVAGMVSAGVSCLSGQVGVKAGDGAMEIAGKTISNGSISAAGAAFVGGDPKDAFKKGAASTLVFASIQKYTGHEPTFEKGGESQLKPDGTEVRNMSNRINHIGLARTGEPMGILEAVSEGSKFSKAVNEIPGMNSMAYFHDILVNDIPPLSYHGPLQVSIIPAIQINYCALGVSRDRYILEQSMESAKRSGRNK